jgi:glycosyltransferase involved in cell wall biosynthesis
MTADVAVVVPAYRAEDTLGGALASVAAQSVQPSEVVVIDDCSPDATAKVAEPWRAMLPLEVVRLDRNGGPARARNEGVARTTASLIAFLDADDIWLPHHLERCLEVHDRTGGVASGRGIMWSDGEDLVRQTPIDVSAAREEAGVDLERIVRHHSFGMHALVPRAVFAAVGGFDDRLDGVEDWDLWIRIARQRVPMHQTAVRTFIYRRRDASVSQDIDRIAANGRRVLERLERSGDADTPEMRSAIRDSRALIAYVQAMSALERGDYHAARRSALPTLRGPRNLAVRGALIAAAPRTYARARTRRHA